MAELIKKTAVVCAEEEEFDDLIRLRQKAGVEEYFYVTTLSALHNVDGMTNIIYLASAKELEEYVKIVEEASEKDVTQKWQ